MTEPRILIEGIGGIGGVVAAKLILAGYDPVLVTHNPAITEAINENGLHLITPERKAPYPVLVVDARAYTTLDEVTDQGPFDAAYLLMKANSAVEAARRTAPLLTPDGYVVTFQNGIVEDAVAEAIGAERVIAGSIGWAAIMRAPGIYEQTGPGAIYVGEPGGPISARVEALAGILKTVAPVKTSANMSGVLWSKLAINCAVNTLAAITGQTLGVMLRDRRMRTLFLHTYREAIDTAGALGVRLEALYANPRLLYLRHDAGPLNAFLKDLIVRLVGRQYGRNKPSTLQSLERGRKTEIDYLNGYVVAQAARVGMDVPVNAALVRLIKEIEDGKRPIGCENVTDLLAAIA